MLCLIPTLQTQPATIGDRSLKESPRVKEVFNVPGKVNYIREYLLVLSADVCIECYVMPGPPLLTY